MVKNIYHLVKKEVRTEKLRMSADVKSRQALLSLFFALTLLLSTLSPVFAEEPAPQPGVQPTPASPVVAEEQPITPGTPGQNQNPMQNPSPEPKQTPAENPTPMPENPANDPGSQENQNPAFPSPNTPTPASPEDQNGAVPPEEGGNTDEDDLEIGPDLAGPAVGEEPLPPMTDIQAVASALIITGKSAIVPQGKRRIVYAYEDDPEKISIPKALGKPGVVVKNTGEFKITVKDPLKSGQVIYLVMVQQIKLGGNLVTEKQSKPLQVPVKAAMADEYNDKIKVPTDTFLLEDIFTYTSEEKKEILDAFKKENSEIQGDISNIQTINLDKAKLTNKGFVTLIFKDNSLLDIKEPIKVKQIEERSRTASIKTIIVTDNTISGELEGDGPFDNIKVDIILKVAKEDLSIYCNKEGCRINKNSQNPVTLPVNPDGTFSYTLADRDNLEIGQTVGIKIKEYHKLVSCQTTEVISPTPKKTKVRDPRKLTETDKEAIDAAIRKAYTRKDGVSKLPDWEVNNIPAYIEFNKDGTVRIINPADVDGDWDNDGNFIPKRKLDGSYVLDSSKNPKIFTIPVQELVLNLPPDKPSMKEDNNDAILIIPNKLDTDATVITVTYDSPDGSSKTATATKNNDGKWSVTSGDIIVDETTGAVTLKVSDVKAGSTIMATVTDAGGLTKAESPLTSDKAMLQIAGGGTPTGQVRVTYDRNGGSGKMDGATLKVGSTYKLQDNAFTAPKNKEFKTWLVNGKELAAGTEITVTKDTVIQAIWQDITPSPSKPDDPSTPRRKFPFFKGKTELLRPHASVWPQDPQGNTPQRPLQNPSLQPNVPLQPGPTAHSPMLVPETGESKMPTTYAWVLLAVAGILMLRKARIHKLG